MDRALKTAAAKAKATPPVEGAPIDKNTVFPVGCSCSGDPKTGVVFQIVPLSPKSKEDFTEWLKANGLYDARAFISDLKSKKASVKVGGVPGPVITVTFK